MKTGCLAIALLCTLLLAGTAYPQSNSLGYHVHRIVYHRSPDRRLTARVVYYKALPGWHDEQSRIDIETSTGTLIASTDYSCSGTGGDSVMRARWTQDSQFFVYSTESMHDHTPAHFYGRRTGRFYYINGLPMIPGDGITDPNFKLLPPARVVLHTDNGFTTTLDLHTLSKWALATAASDEIKYFPTDKD